MRAEIGIIWIGSILGISNNIIIKKKKDSHKTHYTIWKPLVLGTLLYFYKYRLFPSLLHNQPTNYLFLSISRDQHSLSPYLLLLLPHDQDFNYYILSVYRAEYSKK